MTNLEKVTGISGKGLIVGCEANDFAIEILDNSNLSVLYSVDSWNGNNGNNIDKYRDTWEKLYRFGERSVMISKELQEAVVDFKDDDFDLLVMKENINTADWLLKLKSGGVLIIIP